MIYWVVHIAVLGILSYYVFRVLKGGFPGFVFWVALILKLSAGIILGLIFFRYYGSGDTITFFELAKGEVSVNIPNQPRTEFFIQLLRPLVLVTGGSYWITSLWLSFISFVATWYTVITLSKLYPTIKKLIVGCFLFIPSVVFWSSGVLKDSLVFAAIVFLSAVTIKLYRKSKPLLLEFLFFALSLFVLFKIKHYLLITYLIFGGILLAYYLFGRIKGKLKWVFSILTVVLVLGFIQNIHPYLTFKRLAWTIYENNKAINQTSPDNSLNIIIEDESWYAVVKEIPTAIHAGLFRPSIFDQTPIWGLIHRIENLFLTFLIFLSILILVKSKPKCDWMFLGVALGCILLLATILPLVAPNFGTLVRYKNAFMPFLFLIFSILPYQYFNSESGE